MQGSSSVYIYTMKNKSSELEQYAFSQIGIQVPEFCILLKIPITTNVLPLLDSKSMFFEVCRPNSGMFWTATRIFLLVLSKVSLQLDGKKPKKHICCPIIRKKWTLGMKKDALPSNTHRSSPQIPICENDIHSSSEHLFFKV